MRKVAIVGIGTTPWKSRIGDKTFRALGLQVAKRAIEHAKIPKSEVDNVVYSIYCEVMLRQQIPSILMQDYLGFQGLPSLRVEAGAAGEGYALSAAYAQVASGMSDVTLFVALQKGGDFYDFRTKSRGDGFQNGMAISMDTTWQAPVNAGVPAWMTLFCVVPHMEKYGNPTPEQLAKVSVKNYANAYTNPEAQLHQKVTVDDVLNSRIFAWPTTTRMCCLISDGACAMVLASEEKAKEITDKPVWISGIATSSYAIHRARADTIGRMPGTQIASQKAYKMAGITKPIEELDLIQVHDLVTGTEILAYEELGLCEPGGGGRLVDEGVVDRGGRVPSNLDGGRVACGHVGGVSGAYGVCEIVRQLREEAGDRQIPIKNGRGLMQCIEGQASLTNVAVLEREIDKEGAMSDEMMKKEPPFELEYRDWKPEYLYSLGELSPFFREIINNKRLLGSKCPKCGTVWMYPRGDCPDCYEENEWVPLSGEGTVVASSYVYFSGHGIDLLSYLDLPFVYALIHLDGADTYIPHCVKPPSQKMGEIVTGTRVKALFRENRRGTIGDFYFVPVK